VNHGWCEESPHDDHVITHPPAKTRPPRKSLIKKEHDVKHPLNVIFSGLELELFSNASPWMMMPTY
jgi:hypothetical protein